MKEREELELILKLIGKYNLPLSPILEYAVKEKMEEYPDEESLEQGVDGVNNKEVHSFDEEEKEHSSQKKHLNLVSSTSNNTQDGDIKIVDRKGKPWTSSEEELITLYYNQGKDISFIAEKLFRTEIAIKTRLAKLGLIEYAYEKDENATSSLEDNPNKLNKGEYTIENTLVGCSIFDKSGKRVFSSKGKLKIINGNLYRLNLKRECFTLKSMLFEKGIWVKGKSKIVASSSTKLYKVLNEAKDYCDAVENIEDSLLFNDCKMKVGGEWYSSYGNLVGFLDEEKEKIEPKKNNVESDDISSKFSVAIGDKLKVFPSQLVGKVIRLRIDKMGHGKILVQSDDGATEEIYDTKYLYQKLSKKKKESSKTKTIERELIKGETIKEIISDIDNNKRSKVNASLSDWIQWKPTEEVGKVIAFRDDEGVRKMLVRKKNGYEIEIPDNPNDYDILLNKQEGSTQISVAVPQNAINYDNIVRSRIGGVYVGTWIKTQYFIDKCKVIRIESIGPTLEKLIVEFKDGRQDWVIDNPDIYRIVEE